MQQNHLWGHVFLGTRIPVHYFPTTGYGETDLGSGADPWHTGSFDLALQSAQIENFNILNYSSVLSPESVEISIDQAKPLFRHGAVLETIMASVNGRQGDHLCAGVGTIQVRQKSDGKYIGGFAAEYRGHASTIEAREILHQSLLGIVLRRYTSEDVEWFNEKFYIQDFVVRKKFGTVLSALCFVTYLYPIFPSDQVHRQPYYYSLYEI